MAAALAVFETPELLENILLQREDWKQLFVLQRVNKQFEATIRGSLQLRRKMWLAPMPGSEHIDVASETPGLSWTRDPLFNTLYNPLLMRDYHGMGEMRWPNADKCRIFVFPLNTPRRMSMTIYHGRLATDSLILRRGSSWRRTLWTQVAPLPIRLAFESFPKVPRFSKDMVLEPRTTMGDLIDSVQHHLDEVQKRVRTLREGVNKARAERRKAKAELDETNACH